MRKALRSLLVCCAAFLWSIVPSPPVSARGGGGCLEKGTPVLTPSGVIPIEQLKPGDVVLGLAGGAVRSAAIRDILQVRADEIIEIDAGGPVLRATAKHPVGVAPGVFRTASVLRRGDAVMLVIDGKPAIRTVAAVRRHRTGTDAYNILVAEGGTYLADGIVVHNKGCFLPDTRIRREDGTELPISRVRPGDRLLAFTGDGTVVPATVRNVLTHTVEEYLLVRTGQMLLRVTPEHPFYVGNGTFRTLEALRPGDTIHAYDGAGWSEQRITSIESLRTPTTVYNLQTDAPHTFFANGIAVHNKGGGCFPAGTKVRTPAGRTPIEALAAGDLVTAIDERGRPVSARIEEVHATTSRLLTVHTKRGALMTTNEHPLLSTSGDFVHAAMLTPGETVARSRGGRLRPAQVTGLEQGAGPVVVYNLTVDGPHTFVADGFVVHNKGGGGGGSRGGGSRGGGGYRGGGRSSGGGSGRPMTPEQTKWFLIIVGGTLAVVFIIAARGKWRKRSSNLDQIFSRREIEQKGGRTLKLVRFIAQQDPSFSEEKLAGQVRSTFLLLQKCWQAREYGPMRPLMMADLFRDHLRQIEGMKRNHEINMIDGLQVDAIDLVNVRYPLNKDEREFTALITASATDYYLDDRTHERLRGDDAPAPFQEFWTFQYSEGKWLLREIEQAAESDILSDENYFEQFTDKAVDQVYGKAAGTEGPAGPWAEGGALAKEQRIERLLNHLVLTDKLWERNGMLQTARSIFIAVTGAWESGTFAAGLNEKLFPELARDLSEAVKKNEQAGIALEFRNLAVRRAELVLVKNFADNRNDEFVVRIRAHAQKVMKQGGTAVRQEDDVTAFEEYLTFGRLDDQWKLKEIVVPAAGAVMLGQENIDQDSTPRQLEWYYQHKRPV